MKHLVPRVAACVLLLLAAVGCSSEARIAEVKKAYDIEDAKIKAQEILSQLRIAATRKDAMKKVEELQNVLGKVHLPLSAAGTNLAALDQLIREAAAREAAAAKRPTLKPQGQAEANPTRRR